ncbi:MAG: hypothetical protein ABI843_15110 [Dokdonella sp.]
MLSFSRQPSGIAPIVMSLAALFVVLLNLAGNGSAPEPDEGAAAHTFQLLMIGQLPVIAFFVFRWLRRTPRQVAVTLAFQVCAAIAAFAPVVNFHL